MKQTLPIPARAVVMALIVITTLPCVSSSSQTCVCVKRDSVEACTVSPNLKCHNSTHVCCEPVLKDLQIKVWKCTNTDNCSRRSGTCVSNDDLQFLCPTPAYRRKQKLCNTKSNNRCTCCFRKSMKCKISKKCAAKKGFCFTKKSLKACSNGHVKKSGCAGKKCACCIPGPVKCRALKECEARKGYCFQKTDHKACSNGKIIKKACKGKNCACCVPRDPQPSTTMPTPTTSTPTTPTPTPTTSNVVCRCGIANGPRIVGGQQVNPKNKYPWIVGINVFPVTNRTLYDCVGSIINDLYVLTAAHCLFNQDTLVQLNASSVMVGIGDHNQFSTDDDVVGITRQVGVEEFKIFSQFSIVNVDFDIALLKLKEPLDFSPKEIGPICLPKDDTQTYGGDQGIVAGWGTTAEDEINQPAILMEVELPILPAATCEMIMVNFFSITDTMICAGAERGKDACGGDSGGPLSVVERERHVVVGVAAFGEGCARDKPGVYSRVSKYLEWIRNNTQDANYCIEE
ncbi:proclotting enzyme-like [Scylla paramamosain]|uniref:proclotting enzyme-like n=1 Tax=Scylla paramamosain TaxID=85552 RepID=UPI003082F230